MGRVCRLTARCAVVLAIGLTVAVVVVVLGGFLGTHWAPLRALDLAVTDALHGLVTRNGVLREMLTGVTDLGGTGMLLWLLTVGVVWLLVRDQPRPAAYVAMTAVGAVLVTTVLDHVVVPALPPGFSPPGDAMASLVSYGVLLLVLGPVLATGARRAVTAGAVVLVVANGVARMALGVHGLVGLVAGCWSACCGLRSPWSRSAVGDKTYPGCRTVRCRVTCRRRTRTGCGRYRSAPGRACPTRGDGSLSSWRVGSCWPAFSSVSGTWLSGKTTRLRYCGGTSPLRTGWPSGAVRHSRRHCARWRGWAALRWS